MPLASIVINIREICVDENVDTISMLFVDCFCRMICSAICFRDVSFLQIGVPVLFLLDPYFQSVKNGA